MPLTPLNNDFLQCPICFNAFNVDRKPVTLICSHTCCSSCLKSLQNCPFDQTIINHDLPENEAILSLIKDSIISINQTSASTLLNNYLSNISILNNEKLINIFKLNQNDLNNYRKSIDCLQSLAQLIKPQNSTCNLLSRPMQRKLISLLHCQLIEDECRLKCIRICRSIGERITSEFLLKHQDPYTLSSNLWACVRSRGCQFLGPALQEEILKLVLSALEDGSHLSRKVLVMFVVQRLSPNFPQQASKTAIGHVIQLLYRASCFRLTKRDGDSSLMQLKEEYCSYDALRREHDTQIVSIALESGLKISPDQWSSFLYGSSAYKSHMQSIIDKLQSPQSFNQSIQELIIALQRTQDPANLINLKDHLERLAKIDSTSTEASNTTNQQQHQDEIKDNQQNKQNEQTPQQSVKDLKELQYPTYEELVDILESCKIITFRLVDFLKQYNTLFSNIFRFNRNTNYGNTSKFKNTKTTFNSNQQTSKSPNEENKNKFDNLLNNQNLLNNFKPISNLSSNVTLNHGINTTSLVNTTGKLDYSTNSINSLNTTIQSIQSLNSLNSINTLNSINSINSINKLTNGTNGKPCAFVQPNVLQQQNGNCLNTINNNNLQQNKINKIANNLFNNQTNYYANQKISKLNDQNKYQQSNLTANKLNSINLSNNKLANNLKLDSIKLINSNITNENQKNNQNIQNNQQFKNQLSLSPILKHEFDNQFNDLNTQPKSKSAKKSNHNSFSFDDDQFIPFDCDQPKISKFGPISRLNFTQTVTGSTKGLKTENTNVVIGALPSLIRPFNSSLFISNDIRK